MKATTKVRTKVTHVLTLPNPSKPFNKESNDEGNTYLNTIHKMKMRLTENVQKTTRITVCNYDNYQGDRNNYETIVTPIKEVKNIRKERIATN